MQMNKGSDHAIKWTGTSGLERIIIKRPKKVNSIFNFIFFLIKMPLIKIVMPNDTAFRNLAEFNKLILKINEINANAAGYIGGQTAVVIASPIRTCFAMNK